MTDYLGRAPLWAAAVNNHVDVTQLLLEYGSDVGAMDYPGWTYLLLYERRAFFGEIRRLLASYGYKDDREEITGTAWTLLSAREQVLSKAQRYDELISLLREKYFWLHETAFKIRAGIDIFAEGTSGPEQDLSMLILQLQNPYLALMKLGVVYCRSGNYTDGIRDISEIIDNLERRDALTDPDKLIAYTELGNLHFLSGDKIIATEKWKSAQEAAFRTAADAAVQHLRESLAVIESGDEATHVKLRDQLKQRSP